MSFSHDDVERLIRLLDSSHFDELHLEAAGIKLTLRRNAAPVALQPSAPEGDVPPRPTVVQSTVTATPPVATARPTGDPKLVEIRAPMLGTFYGAPKPGADPFVAVGARVAPDSPVGIIEVMKLMNSVSAGVEGVLVEVLVRDGELVEFEQVLMRVRPV